MAENRTRKKEKAFVAGTGLNYIGFVIMLFDALTSWMIRPIGMTGIMAMPKAISIIFMIAGTTIFCMELDENKGQDVRKFVRVNIFAYAIVVSLLIYFIDLPIAWRGIFYTVVVVVAEVILRRKKK